VGNYFLAVFITLSLFVYVEKGNRPVSDEYDFIVKSKGEYTYKNLVLKMSFMGQQGKMLINGKNRWFFDMLLEPSDPRAVGAQAGFSYEEPFVKWLNTGVNKLEYIPLRQNGATDDQQILDITIKYLEGDTLYDAKWRAEDLIDGENKVIHFLIEEYGILGSDEAEIDSKDITIQTHTFGD